MKEVVSVVAYMQNYESRQHFPLETATHPRHGLLWLLVIVTLNQTFGWSLVGPFLPLYDKADR